MTPKGWTILALLNIPLYVGIGCVFFRDWRDFWKSIRFWLIPDIVSLLRREYWDDRRAEANFVIWAGCCWACVWTEGYLIGRMIG